MRFSLTIPEPGSMRVGKESYFTLRSGTEVHRVHRTRFKADEYNDTDRGNSRFAPIRDASGTLIPTIYAAESFDCAVCEIILRCPDAPRNDPVTGLPTLNIVYPADFAEHSHSRLITTRDLVLVDLTIAGQRKIGVNQNALLAGPASTYPATRAWAEKIHESCPKAQGLYYSSFQLGPQFAILLFGDRVPPGVLAPQSTRPIADHGCHNEIFAIGQSLSIEYVDV